MDDGSENDTLSVYYSNIEDGQSGLDTTTVIWEDNNIDIELLKHYVCNLSSADIKDHIFKLFEFINSKIEAFQSKNEDKSQAIIQ